MSNLIISEDIDILRSNTLICHYTSYKALIQIIKKRAIKFSSAKQMEDPKEGSLTDRAFVNTYYKGAEPSKNEIKILKKYHKYTSFHKAFSPLKEYTKICSWTVNEKENNLMRKVYASKDGVIIKTTIGLLLKHLGEYKIMPYYKPESIHIGLVKYVDYREELNVTAGFLDRFFYKDVSYKDEKEVRLVISLRLAAEYGIKIPEDEIYVPVDLEDIFQEIVFYDLGTKALLEKKIVEERLCIKTKLSYFDDDEIVM